MNNLLTDPTIPAYDHAIWCRSHSDGGMWDQACGTVAGELRPDGKPLSDPQTIRVGLVQFQDRDHNAPEWKVDAPRIELHLVADVTESRWSWAGSDITLAEARTLAAELLNLVELAETETGRCAR